MPSPLRHKRRSISSICRWHNACTSVVLISSQICAWDLWGARKCLCGFVSCDGTFNIGRIWIHDLAQRVMAWECRVNYLICEYVHARTRMQRHFHMVYGLAFNISHDNAKDMRHVTFSHDEGCAYSMDWWGLHKHTKFHSFHIHSYMITYQKAWMSLWKRASVYRLSFQHYSIYIITILPNLTFTDTFLISHTKSLASTKNLIKISFRRSSWCAKPVATNMA